MTFAINNIEIRLEKADNENRPCIDRPETAKTTNIAIEATQALKMFFAWFLIEDNEGVSKPKVSFVVAVEPTTEPTSPTKPIKAG